MSSRATLARARVINLLAYLESIQESRSPAAPFLGMGAEREHESGSFVQLFWDNYAYFVRDPLAES